MIRLITICAVIALMLAACGQKQENVTATADRISRASGGMAAMEAASTTAPAPPPNAPQADANENAPKLAYTHSLTLEMAASRVNARFERARTLCLNNAAIHCALVHASIELGDAQTSSPPSATMTVRLPHDQIASFEQNLLSPLPGEDKGEPILRESTTDAEDLTYAIADGDRRLKQAEDYRDRLMALAKISEAKVQDLIEIEEKLSEVQSNIEELSGEQRQLNERVDTEVLNINLNATQSVADVRSPLARAWNEAGTALGESAAEAFTFVVSALPWLPIIALGLWLLTWLWRLVRGRRRKAATASTDHG